MLVGYARISPLAPDPTVQHEALQRVGCDQVFTDTVTSVKAPRPELAAALAATERSDTLVVWRLDCLARSLSHLIETVSQLEERGVGLRSLSESIDTTTAGGTLFLQVIGALAQFQRDLVRERTRAGLAAARARGNFGGAKYKLTPTQEAQLQAAYQTRNAQTGEPEHTIGELCDLFQISPATLWRYVRHGSKRLTPTSSSRGVQDSPAR